LAEQTDGRYEGRGEARAAMHTLIHMLARGLALIGGFTLVMLIAITVISILGRTGATLAYNGFVERNLGVLAEALIASGIGPVNGDFEMVEIGIAFAIFCFLPWCQLTSGHATVDLFTAALPGRANRFLIFFWEVVLALVIILIAWRLGVGMSDKMRYGETTFLLQLPVWYGFAASFAASIAAAVVAIYVAGVRGAEFWTGKDLLAELRGARG
jgi:TRAP-type C4-dicarboxylate transport system permease small subunit